MQHILKQIFIRVIGIMMLLEMILNTPIQAFAMNSSSAEALFIEHCSACHINGGNIIRRGKTLKLSDLKRRDLDNQEAIAKIAREGIGIMNGYEEFLGEDGDQAVAIWILNQAQKAWVQG